MEEWKALNGAAPMRISRAKRRFLERGGGWSFPGERVVHFKSGGGRTTMALVEALVASGLVRADEEFVRDDGHPSGLRVSEIRWVPTATWKRLNGKLRASGHDEPPFEAAQAHGGQRS